MAVSPVTASFKDKIGRCLLSKTDLSMPVYVVKRGYEEVGKFLAIRLKMMTSYVQSISI